MYYRDSEFYTSHSSIEVCDKSDAIYVDIESHEELEKERDELKAQVEQLQNQVRMPSTSDEASAMALVGMGWLESNDKRRLTEFHNKYAQEIKAQAVENLEEPLFASGKADADIGEWLKEQAKLIRQQVKGGE